MKYLCLGVLCTTLGCETEQTIISSNNLFSNIPGAVSGIPSPERKATAPKEFSEAELVIKNPDGTVTLRSPQVASVMLHLSRELNKDPVDERLVYDQLVSEATKQFLRAENRDPTESITFLKENRLDLFELMGQMPAAERTPGVFLERSDARNIYRLRLTGPMSRVTRYTEMWVALEGGNWKFYWAR
ncbi:MAG: hypothetical protein ACREJO_09935 [Phycisphaerales bacterium]